MLEGFSVVFFLLAVIVIAAIAVIVGLALVRRPAPDWQRHLRAQGQAISEEPPLGRRRRPGDHPG